MEQGKYALLYSTDLSAAFDMLNPAIFKKCLKNMGLPDNLSNVLYDYITDGQAYVDIDGSTSQVFDILLGCVQGSILGPVIFSIFMRPLNELKSYLTSYVYDSYGIMEVGPEVDVAPLEISERMDWLKQSEMLANESKT